MWVCSTTWAVGLPWWMRPWMKKAVGLDRVLALDDVAVAVGHHQIGRRDLRPVQALRIDQEQVGRGRARPC